MADSYDRAASLVLVMLKGEASPTPEIIQKKVNLVLAMLQAEGNLDSVDRDRLIRDIESRCEVWRGTATILEEKRITLSGFHIEKVRLNGNSGSGTNAI
jgi:hypothetical protein